MLAGDGATSSMAASITRPERRISAPGFVGIGGAEDDQWMVLPSPACAMTEIITCSSSAIAATFSMRSGSIAMVRHILGVQQRPEALDGGIAIRRATVNASPLGRVGGGEHLRRAVPPEHLR